RLARSPSTIGPGGSPVGVRRPPRLSHRATRGAGGTVSAVRLGALGLARVPESPLSHMSDMGHRPGGGSAAGGVTPSALLPPRVYRASRPQCAHAGEQPSLADPAVPHRQPEPAPIGPAPPGRPTRRDAGVAHLGPDAQGPLPPPLPCPRWRIGRGRPPLGAPPSTFPLPGAGLEHALPRQVPRGLPPGLPPRGRALGAGGCLGRRPSRLPPAARPALWPGMGGLRPAPGRWANPGARVPRTL